VLLMSATFCVAFAVSMARDGAAGRRSAGADDGEPHDMAAERRFTSPLVGEVGTSR